MDLAHLPLSWANYLSIMGFVCLLVLVWLVPRNIVYEDAPDQSRWRDIRLGNHSDCVPSTPLWPLYPVTLSRFQDARNQNLPRLRLAPSGKPP